MNIILKKYISESYRIGKNFSGNSLTVPGDYRGPVDVINTKIVVEAENILNYNYLEIPSNNRKYFIEDYTAVGQNLFELSCREDVLDTYKSEILQSSGLIEKRSVGYNAYINDGTIFTESRNIFTTQHFKDNGSAYHSDSNGYTCFDPTTWEYILITGGPGDTQSP